MDTLANRAAMPKSDYKAWPKVEEVAATILFLASPENKVTRGAIVPFMGSRDDLSGLSASRAFALKRTPRGRNRSLQ